MSETTNRNRRRVITGLVSSAKMNKTIVVDVERTVQHPRFKKYVRQRTRFKAHDENNEAQVGDMVQIMETRPISKTKSFRLVKILKTARIPAATPEVESIDSGTSEE